MENKIAEIISTAADMDTESEAGKYAFNELKKLCLGVGPIHLLVMKAECEWHTRATAAARARRAAAL